MGHLRAEASHRKGLSRQVRAFQGKQGPFKARQATEVNSAGASEASGGPCGEPFLVETDKTQIPESAGGIELDSRCRANTARIRQSRP